MNWQPGQGFKNEQYHGKTGARTRLSYGTVIPETGDCHGSGGDFWSERWKNLPGKHRLIYSVIRIIMPSRKYRGEALCASIRSIFRQLWIRRRLTVGNYEIILTKQAFFYTNGMVKSECLLYKRESIRYNLSVWIKKLLSVRYLYDKKD